LYISIIDLSYEESLKIQISTQNP